MTVLTLSVGSGMACFQEHCSGGKSRFDHVQFSSVGFGVFYIVKMIIRTGGHFESAGINLFNRAHTLSATYNIITQSKITGAQFCSWKSLLCCSNLIQLNIWLIWGFSIHNSLALLKRVLLITTPPDTFLQIEENSVSQCFLQSKNQNCFICCFKTTETRGSNRSNNTFVICLV